MWYFTYTKVSLTKLLFGNIYSATFLLDLGLKWSKANCKRIPHFLYETYQYSSVPGRQMLNSCIRMLLNHICGEKRLFVRHFDLIPTKEKQGREMAEAVSMFWINLKIIWSMSTLMWLKGRLLQYYSVSQVSSLYLFAGYFLKISSTFRLDFNHNASFIIHLILFFIYKKSSWSRYQEATRE